MLIHLYMNAQKQTQSKTYISIQTHTYIKHIYHLAGAKMKKSVCERDLGVDTLLGLLPKDQIKIIKKVNHYWSTSKLSSSIQTKICSLKYLQYI